MNRTWITEPQIPPAGKPREPRHNWPKPVMTEWHLQELAKNRELVERTMKTIAHSRNLLSETFMFHFGGHGPWARLTAQGAVKLNGRVMGKDEEAHLETGDILKVGKREWIIGEAL